MDDEIYSLVEDFAKKNAHGEQVTVYHLLSAFAKVLSMDQKVLQSLLDSQEEQEKLARMCHFLDVKNIDLELMKQSFSIILSNLSEEQKNQTLETVFPGQANVSDSSELLEKLLNLPLPELQLVTKGKNLDDTLNYVKQQKPSGEPSGHKKVRSEKKKADQTAAAEELEASCPESGQQSGDAFSKLILEAKQLYSSLLGKVKGQDEAIRTFVAGYFQSAVFRAQEKNKRPAATFLFAGPPGVGKTFLAESAAEFLKLPFARFDMSEYSNNLSTEIFAGVEKQYRGSKPGLVTDFVSHNPRSVILFDEIEKADTSIVYLFLQILDGGILTDNYTGEKVSFRDTILLFTTNVGRGLYDNPEEKNLSVLPKSVILDAIRNETANNGAPVFPAAICSRFASGNVVMFNHLSVHHLADIIQDRFAETARMAQAQYHYNLVIDPRLAMVSLYNQGGALDARTASAQGVNLIKNELYEFARHLPNPEETLGRLDQWIFSVNLESSPDSVKKLFTYEETPQILIFGDKKAIRLRETDRFSCLYASDLASVRRLLKENDAAFLLIDLLYGEKEIQKERLSADDWGTAGIAAFDWIRENIPDLPLYLLDNPLIDTEDRATFLQRGARGFVPCADGGLLEREIVRLSQFIYLQRKYAEMTSRGKNLSFNTMQTLSPDGKKAEVQFYDFKLKSAVNGDARGLMLADQERPTERFADVIGAENAKEELRYFVDFLKNPKKGRIDGSRPPKGILLYGPPGTGKTMLARAMAGESEAAFFPVTAAAFQDKYIGEGEKRIRNLFAMAKSYAPSIIFIDEIDAIGKERVGSTSTHHTEMLLNTLLTEMDGFEVGKKPVFVLAATNYALDRESSGKQSAIDPALLRRFDNRIYVDLPNESERKEYLSLLCRKRRIQAVSEGTLENIAQRTTGDSLAILQNVFELAVRNAAKRGVDMSDEILLNAFEEYRYGEKREWNERYYREVSVHESGHALVSWLSGEKPSFITIVSRGNFGGYMQPENQEKTPNYTRTDLLWKIRTCLAGRAAEIVVFGEERGINTGVSSDLRMATNYAINIFSRYGMAEDSLISLDPKVLLGLPYGEKLLREADALLKREMENTLSLIRENRGRLDRLSGRLLEKNQLMTEEILELLQGNAV